VEFEKKREVVESAKTNRKKLDKKRARAYIKREEIKEINLHPGVVVA